MGKGSMSLAIIRPADEADHPAFLALFAHLEVDDPLPTVERFAREIMPTMLVATSKSGEVAGYTFFQLLGKATYVRHIAVAESARRHGVGRALMAAAANQGRAAGATEWCLNVKEANTGALRFYEALGFTRAYSTRVVRMAWALVDEATDPGVDTRPRFIEEGDEASVESRWDLPRGLVGDARKKGGRVLMMLESPTREADSAIVGSAIFDPTYPGAFPFRAASVPHAYALLRALRAYALPQHNQIQIVIEKDDDLARVLVERGAMLRQEIVHLRGPLPAAATGSL